MVKKDNLLIELSITLLILAHFSTMVGAVHNLNYTMFEIGSYANRGLSQLVLTGDTHTLEQELANEVSRNPCKGLSHFQFSSSSSNSLSDVIEDRLVHIF